MAQSNPLTQTTIMETSDSDDSIEEVPLTLVQPKASTSGTAKPKNGGKSRRRKATKDSNGEFDLVCDVPDSANNQVTNKCKIGKDLKILTIT